ncbi:MAG: peptide deformylase [Hyphomicrobiales bacterium]|nr:peptide deformylase [Hyphomicrobiales bacterium]
MAIRDIITLPDPRLRLESTPVGKIDEALRALMDDMLQTMYDAPGIGLAAIQVAVAKRVVVVDVAREEEEPNPIRLINPEIVWTSEETSTHEEGCLSIPEFYGDVERPARCRVAFLDDTGERREMECEGLLATVVQHEVDHTNGVLFIDHLSKLKRDRIVKKFSKAKKRESAA